MEAPSDVSDAGTVGRVRALRLAVPDAPPKDGRNYAAASLLVKSRRDARAGAGESWRSGTVGPASSGRNEERRSWKKPNSWRRCTLRIWREHARPVEVLGARELTPA